MTKKYSLFYISAIVFIKCVAASDLSSLTFVIDSTYSMWNDIAEVRRGASEIFDTVVSHKDTSQIDNFILVTFNDRSDRWYQPDLKVMAKTKDRNVFMSALSAITTSGGAVTCAELPLAGIKKGLEESLPKSSIFVFTDATAKDYSHYEEVKRIAQEKQCQIVFALTGQCREPVTSPGYKVYQSLAKATNGHVFHLNKGEVGKILEYVKKTITGPRTTLVDSELSRGVHNVTFNADTLMEELLLSLASTVTNNPTVNIKAPDGTDVWKTILFETLYAKVYSVNVTKPGQHIVEVNSPSTSTRAVVTAKTEIDFQHGFSTFIPLSIDDTSTRPVPGVTSHLSIKLTNGNINLKSVQILDMKGNVKLDLPLAVSNKESKFYTTEAFDPPASDFKIAVTGFDPVSKSTVTRQASTPVEVQKTLSGDTITDIAPSVVIEGGGKVNANYGEPLQLVCKVEGYPKPNIYWKNKQTGVILSEKVSLGKNYPYDYINVLYIEKVNENATYTCEARNRVSSNMKEIAVEVTQNKYLKITSRSQNSTLDCEKEAKISCLVDAYPPADITWYKNDVKIKTGGNIEISNDNSILTIKGVMPADNGKYTCEAKNEVTKQSIEYHVVVVGLEDVVIDKTVMDVSVIKGKSTTIECKILKGKPTPRISWTLETPMKYVFNVDNWINQARNVISNANENDAGIYRCEAENDFSRDSHEVQVVVV